MLSWSWLRSHRPVWFERFGVFMILVVVVVLVVLVVVAALVVLRVVLWASVLLCSLNTSDPTECHSNLVGRVRSTRKFWASTSHLVEQIRR